MAIQCPNCKAQLKSRPEYESKRARCPKCKRFFIDWATITLSAEIIKESKSIKNKILNLDETQSSQTFYFCSMSPAEGTTSIVLAVSITLAKHSNYKTLLIDGNHCAPKISTLFKDIEKRETDDGNYQINFTGIENLYCAVRRKKNSSINVLTEAIKLLKEQRESFDIIMIDGSPIEQVSDLSILRNSIDGIVMVIESEKSRAEVLADAVKEIESSGIKVLGAILNKNKKLIPDFIYEKL